MFPYLPVDWSSFSTKVEIDAEKFIGNISLDQFGRRYEMVTQVGGDMSAGVVDNFVGHFTAKPIQDSAQFSAGILKVGETIVSDQVILIASRGKQLTVVRRPQLELR